MPAFLRALLITDPLIVLATALYGTISLLTSLFDSTGRAQHRVACAWGRMLLRVSGVKMRVEGLEYISPGSSYVFVSNHLSLMDIPAILPHIPVQFRFMAKKSLFRVPFIGYHLKRAGHIPVHRLDARASLKTMADAAAIIRDRGVSVLAFPEAGAPRTQCATSRKAPPISRSRPVCRPFRWGSTHLEVLPMDSLLVKPGDVLLRIGKPVPTAGLAVHDRHKLTAELRDRIVDLTKGVYRTCMPRAGRDVLR